MGLSGTITIILATTGTVLGIINSVIQLNKNRVILKVIPKSALLDKVHFNGELLTRAMGMVNTTGKEAINKNDCVCIEVINLSSFPVTISEVGFTLKHSKGLRIVMTKPITLNKKSLPRRLDSRESQSFYGKLTNFDLEHFCLIKSAYAKTDCGIVKKGKSPALKELIKIASDIVVSRLSLETP